MKKKMIINGDNIDVLRCLPDNSIDSVITDPPYGLKFMSKKWDYDVPSVELWSECLRVLKPGGHLVSFGGTRTYHRLVTKIEDAGFEIREMIHWAYGSGFPKSLNVGKAVDKLQGNEREEVGKEIIDIGIQNGSMHANRTTKLITRNITKGTSAFEGYGTALKPAHEPICIARKPLSEKNVALNVMKWGTGGINIDAGRVGIGREKGVSQGVSQVPNRDITKLNYYPTTQGRFPANLIHDGSDEVLELFPMSVTGAIKPYISKHNPKNTPASFSSKYGSLRTYTVEKSHGSASRFFAKCEYTEDDLPPLYYCAKASPSERNEGLEGFETRKAGTLRETESGLQNHGQTGKPNKPTYTKNFHPTVKPIKLMSYLVKLFTPTGGTVLDMYCGSGTTGIAAALNGFEFIGIEKEFEYYEIALARVEHFKKKVA